MGVGNTLRGDDGIGPAIIESLKGNVKAVCIDAGSAPESYAGKIVKENPDTVLLVDAAHLGLTPGQFEILKKEDILKSGFTTHDLSPNMFMEYLESEIQADIYMLAVQPEKVSFGDEMSELVSKTLQDITQLIKDSLNFN